MQEQSENGEYVTISYKRNFVSYLLIKYFFRLLLQYLPPTKFCFEKRVGDI